MLLHSAVGAAILPKESAGRGNPSGRNSNRCQNQYQFPPSRQTIGFCSRCFGSIRHWRLPRLPETLWTQHHNAQFRTTNGAAEWSTISETFGFAVAAHPKNPETAWFVPAQKDEFRIPADGEFCVLKTEDGGKNFRRITAGLPPKPCFDLIYRHALDVDGEGRDLAFGSTTGNLWASGDSGESWRVVSNHLPPIYCLKFLH